MPICKKCGIEYIEYCFGCPILQPTADECGSCSFREYGPHAKVLLYDICFDCAYGKNHNPIYSPV